MKNSIKLVLIIICFAACENDKIDSKNAPDIVTNKMIHYEFANNLNDISGNSFNGINDTAIDFVPDRFSRLNQAIRFNGPLHKSNFIVPAFGNKQVGNKFSISFWFTITTANSNNLLFKNDFENNLQTGITINTTNGKLGVSTGDGTNSVTHLANSNLAQNTWHHVAVCIDSNITKIYFNGLPYNSFMSSTTNGNYTSPAFTNSNTAKGLLGGLAPYALTDGKLDDFRIYARTLNAAEVNLLYEYKP